MCVWGGGGEGVGDFEKKTCCKRLLEEKIACSTNEIEKVLALLQARKKNVAKLFHHSWGVYKIPAKLQPFWIIWKPASHSG